MREINSRRLAIDQSVPTGRLVELCRDGGPSLRGREIPSQRKARSTLFLTRHFFSHLDIVYGDVAWVAKRSGLSVATIRGIVRQSEARGGAGQHSRNIR